MIPDYAPLLVFAVVGVCVLTLGWLLLRLGRTHSRGGRQVFGILTDGIAAVTPQFGASARRLELDLRRAGYYRPRARQDFLAVRNMLLITWAVLTAATIALATEPRSTIELIVLSAGVVGAVLILTVPRLWIQWQAAARVRRIQFGLPDALDMMTMCLTGGLPLQDAMDRVTCEIRTTHPDLSMEFDIVQRQAAASTMEQALDQFARRIDAPDVTALTALVSQAERLGSNVATALRDYSDSIRRSHRQRAEERGNKATVKLLFPIALCLAPPVYILLLAPALLEIRDFVTKESRPGGILAQSIPRSRFDNLDTLNRPLYTTPPTPEQPARPDRT